MFKKIAALATAAVLCAGLMAGCCAVRRADGWLRRIQHHG